MIDLETLVPMPAPPLRFAVEVTPTGQRLDYSKQDMAAMRADVAREVAKRCAEICKSKAGTSEYDDSTSRYLAQDIAAEFGGDV